MRGLYLLSVWLHILAAMTWVGGMVTFVVAVMPYIRRQDPAVSRAFIAWFGPRFRVLGQADRRNGGGSMRSRIIGSLAFLARGK